MDPEGLQLDFTDLDSLRQQIPHMTVGELVTALEAAAAIGDGDLVNLFAQALKPGDRGTGAILAAMQRGQADVVDQLINLCGTTENYDYALVEAVATGHPEIVQAVLKVANPAARNYEALRVAVKQGDDTIIGLMFQHVTAHTAILDAVRSIQHVQDEWLTVIDELLSCATPATRTHVSAALLQWFCRLHLLAQRCSGLK
jgi:hypothetical protein